MGVRKIPAGSFYGCLQILTRNGCLLIFLLRSPPALPFPRPSHRLSAAHRPFVNILFSIQWVSAKSRRALSMGVCWFSRAMGVCWFSCGVGWGWERCRWVFSRGFRIFSARDPSAGRRRWDCGSGRGV